MDQYYRSIISGERAGALPALSRGVFEVVSWFYTLAVMGRNALFDLGIRRTHRLPVPVISVGNITTGGTGKTPTVILLVQELQRLGMRPAVLTRGYGARRRADGTLETPDEVMVIQQECPGVPVIVNADRVAGGRQAIAQHGANVLIMDDGFQHRRLHRDLNIVLVDATEPMGIPGVLPRGTWREPPSALKRADVIMLTRVEQVTSELADLAAGLLTQWVSPRDIYQQQTQVVGMFDEEGREVAENDQPREGAKVLVFAGIGNPTGFLHTVRGLGLRVSAACWFDDHYPYASPEDFAPLEKLTRERSIVAWVTTLKDWAKLRGRVKSSAPIWHIRIESKLTGRQAELFRQRLERLVRAASEGAQEGFRGGTAGG